MRCTDSAVAESAQGGGFEHREGAETVTDAAGLRIGIGRDWLHFRAPDIGVSGDVRGCDVDYRLTGNHVFFAMTYGFDVADFRIIGGDRPVTEIPHYFRSDLRVVRVQQRKRQSGDVVFQKPLIAQAHLRRILFGRALVGGRPCEARGRNDRHSHSLFNQEQVAWVYQICHRRRVVGRDDLAGLDRGGVC